MTGRGGRRRVAALIGLVALAAALSGCVIVPVAPYGPPPPRWYGHDGGWHDGGWRDGWHRGWR